MKLGDQVLALSMLALGAACGASEGPPAVAVDRTPCDHCGMLISDLDYAAAYRLPGEATRVFDDLGCMLDELRGWTLPADAAVWVHEFGGETWLRHGEAVFVRSSRLHTPMGGGIVAVASLAAAERLAEEVSGEVVPDFVELLRVAPEDHDP